MKKYFITGLIILLPLAITCAVVVFVINFFTQPFVGFFEQFLEKAPWYPQYKVTIHFFLKIFLLVAIFLFTVLLGFLARAIVFRSLLSLYDFMMHRIPLIRTLYKATQQVIKTLFGSSSQSFKQVVMIPYPKEKSYCLGLVSNPAPTLCEKTLDSSLITVFVPTTPNPTSGFLIMYPKDEVIYLDMKIEDAFKYIISCGVINATEDGFPLSEKNK